MREEESSIVRELSVPTLSALAGQGPRSARRPTRWRCGLAVDWIRPVQFPFQHHPSPSLSFSFSLFCQSRFLGRIVFVHLMQGTGRCNFGLHVLRGGHELL